MTNRPVYMFDPETGTSTRTSVPSIAALVEMGPRERYVWENARRNGLSITQEELKHARHDDGCHYCQENYKTTDYNHRTSLIHEEMAAMWRISVSRLLDSIESDTEGKITKDQVVKSIRAMKRESDNLWKRVRELKR